MIYMAASQKFQSIKHKGNGPPRKKARIKARIPKKLFFALTRRNELLFSLTSPKKCDFFADQPKKN